jgi:hypothetical protein
VDEHGTPLAVGPPALAATCLGGGTTHTSNSSGSSSHHGSNSTLAGSAGSNALSSSGGGGGSSAPAAALHSKGPSYAGMAASQRSMALWQRVSPGMLPDTTKTPPATTAEAFAYEPALLEPLDVTHHLKRTDFADYVECRLRHMHHIAAAAKK